MVFENAPLISHTVQAAASPTNWWPIFISGVSALLAAFALVVTFAKYRMDLYNHRFAIYTATVDLILAALNDDADEMERLNPAFVKAVREAQFLFPEESRIYDQLVWFRDEIARLKSARNTFDKAEEIKAGFMTRQIESHLTAIPETLEGILLDIEKRLRPFLTYRILDCKFWRYWMKPPHTNPYAPENRKKR